MVNSGVEISSCGIMETSSWNSKPPIFNGWRFGGFQPIPLVKIWEPSSKWNAHLRSNMVQHYPNPPGHQLSWPYRWVDTISSMLCFHWQFPNLSGFDFNYLWMFLLSTSEKTIHFLVVIHSPFLMFFWYPSRIHVFLWIVVSVGWQTNLLQEKWLEITKPPST